MLINLKVKTLDARTHDFSIDNEVSTCMNEPACMCVCVILCGSMFGCVHLWGCVLNAFIGIILFLYFQLTIRQFKDQIAEKTNIAAENQRIIYQGRVLSDEKQVKEYGESWLVCICSCNQHIDIWTSLRFLDVDGKVLHVAERPPFSQRGANATNNDEPMRNLNRLPGRPAPRNLRNAPYFRALDGMLVGTMAIPVNNGPLTAAGVRIDTVEATLNSCC